MKQLESIKAKHQTALVETCRTATSNEFVNCARLASEYVHLISFNYGMMNVFGYTAIEKLEKLLLDPETQLLELRYFVNSDLVPELRTPTIFSRERIEYEITKAKDEVLRADKALFSSAQKTDNASRRLKSQEKRLARFVELENQVPTWIAVLGLFVAQYDELRKIEKVLASTMRRHQKKIEFERLHGIAYAKASALDAKTRQRGSMNKINLTITEKCPYCNGPMGSGPNADHIYPVKRGGLSTIENMVYCCQICNSRKGDKGLVEFLMAEGLDLDVVYETLRSMGKRI